MVAAIATINPDKNRSSAAIEASCSVPESASACDATERARAAGQVAAKPPQSAAEREQPVANRGGEALRRPGNRGSTEPRLRIRRVRPTKDRRPGDARDAPGDRQVTRDRASA